MLHLDLKKSKTERAISTTFTTEEEGRINPPLSFEFIKLQLVEIVQFCISTTQKLQLRFFRSFP